MVVLVIVSWFVMFISLVSTILGLFQNLWDFTILELLSVPQYQYIVFFIGLIAAAFLAVKSSLENRKIEKGLPKLQVKDYGFEIKFWKNKPKNLMAYIQFINQPKGKVLSGEAQDVLAEVDWLGIFQTNPGRWFYPNNSGTAINQRTKVSISANGEVRKLHFAAFEFEDLFLRAIWRSEEGAYCQEVSMDEEVNYRVMISLRDSKNIKSTFYFIISAQKTVDDISLELVKVNKNWDEIDRAIRTSISIADIESFVPSEAEYFTT